MEELKTLQIFLSNPDPRKVKGFILLSLREELQRVSGHEKAVLDLVQLALASLDPACAFHQSLTPEERFRLLRVIPHGLALADGDAEDPKSFSVFRSSRLPQPGLQKLLRRHPVLPLYADMVLSTEFVLQKAPHFDKQAMGAAWLNDASGDARAAAIHNICSGWDSARDASTQITAQLALLLNKLHGEDRNVERVLSDDNAQLAQEVFALVCLGFQRLSEWTASIQLALAWKYAHPASLDPSGEPLQGDGAEYARALRWNLSCREKSVLVDVVSMVKALETLLLRAEALLAPFIRLHVHLRIQQLVQRDLTPLLHRLDKRNKPILPSLLKLRSLAADWLNGVEPRKDYREYSRKQQGQAAVHPARVVGAADTQLFILRMQVCSLCDSSSELRKKSSVFVKADLERSDVQIFEQFYRDSFFFPYALAYKSTLRSVAYLGDLWYREFYLEMTKCIQFPIEMSLPWILTEHLVSSPSRVSNSPMLENLLFVLDIYNDAAQSALYVKNQQYLYDEIEAELNLVIDQLYFLLADEMYCHFKNLAASTLLEPACRNKLEALWRPADSPPQPLWVEASRIESLLAQRHVHLLGRSVNLALILAQHVADKLRRDVEFAVSRFESGDARGVIDLAALLAILRETHRRLAQHLQLLPFELLLAEVNESAQTQPGSRSVRGRIATHMLASLQQDVLPNFSYNAHTQRFTPSPIAIRPAAARKPPKHAAVLQTYGLTCGRVFDLGGKLTRGFFGPAHLESYLSLDSSLSDTARLVSDCQRIMFEKIRDLAEYLAALKASLSPAPLPAVA